MAALFIVLLVLLVLFASMDLWHFIRFFYFAVKREIILILKTKFGVSLNYSLEDVLRPVVLPNVVLPSDIDLFMHMNNSKYLREMDFGRLKLYHESGIREEAGKRGAVTLVAAVSIRYRRSLPLWSRFSLSTRIVYWSNEAFYLEQRFLGQDGFTHAIAMVKMVARSKSGRVSPAEMIKHLTKVEKEVSNVENPPISPELKYWIKSLEKSSESMKNDPSSTTSQKQD